MGTHCEWVSGRGVSYRLNFLMFVYMKRLFIALVVCVVAVSAVAQGGSVPYYCGFETEEECSAWGFGRASGVTTGFAIGDAIRSTGAQSLYTTCDGGVTAGYLVTSTGYCSTAYTKLSLSAGLHSLYFDYKIMTGADFGETGVMVSVVPASTNLKPFALAMGMENFPKKAAAGQVWVSDPTVEYKKSGWNVKSAVFDVESAGEYYLVLLFKQQKVKDEERFGVRYKDRTGVSVDNVIIERYVGEGYCNSIPTAVTAVEDTAGVKVTWSGGTGASYDLIYYRISRDASEAIVPDTVSGLTVTEYVLPYASMDNGVYTVKVRSRCAAGVSAWADVSPVIVYGPSDYCIEYWKLDDKRTKCTMGAFGSPFEKIQKLDFGYESRESYHTVHWDTTEYDPVTDYKLKTVLSGHWASVRLGQGADIGPDDGVSPGRCDKRMSAALTYTYKVPEDADLFLLNYAPVLQFAAHHPENMQTQIVIEVLDQFGTLLDSKCLRSKFNSIRLKMDEVAGTADPGWNSFRPKKGQFGAVSSGSPDEIKWHDWMVMGFNLKRYAGELVQFRISLDPCGEEYHFAYVYLVPMCASAVVEGMSCTERTETFEVPDGFKYRWYKQNDKSRKVVCRERFFTPAQDDTDSYYVDLMNKEDTTCYFTLEAYILPRTPRPEWTSVQVSEKCRNMVSFDASGTRVYEIRETGDVAVDESKAKVSDFRWDFGEYGGVVTGARQKCEFPAEGGVFPMTLTCEYGGCTVDTTFDLTVAPLENEVAVFEKTICEGDVFTVNGKDYMKDGVVYDTIAGGSYYGCDSVLKIDLHVVPHTTIDTTVSVTSDMLPYALRIDGKSHTLTAPKDTVIVVASRELRKCDSITYNVHFEVEAMLEVALDALPEICADDDVFTLKYTVSAGYFDSVYVVFDDAATAAGFTSEGVTDTVENGLTVPMPEAGVRPDYYHCDMVFTNVYGGDTVGVDFAVLYPDSVIAQRWNDVLALKNREHNGGYEFVAYQWFYNGVPAEGHIASQYYVEGANLDFAGEYALMLTRADDGKSIMTCALMPTEFAIGTGGYTEDLTVTFESETVTANVPQAAKAYVYDASGALCAVHDFAEGDNRFTLPRSRGIYLLRVVYPDGSVSAVKIVR